MSFKTALCFVLASDGSVPEWIELIPAPDANGIVRGKDGRAWKFANAAEVAANFDLKLPIDANHSTEIKAPIGEESPAFGWIEQLQARNGALWGRVDWTERGANALKSRDYRFVSPVFTYSKSTMEVVRLTSAALVNNPNFDLALNFASAANATERTTRLAALMNGEIDRRATDAMPRAAIIERMAKAAGIEHGTVNQILRGDIEMPPLERLRGFAQVLNLTLESLMDALPDSASNHANPEQSPMSIKAILAALKLSETATEADAVNAIHGLNSQLATASNAAQAPDIAKFVPRAEFDAVQAKATNAEAALNTLNKTKAQADIDAAVSGAISAGKITPASKEYFTAMCAAEGGLAKFKAFIDTQPAIVGAGAGAQNGLPPAGQTTLTAEQKALCAQIGVKEETFLEELRELSARNAASTAAA